MWLITFLRKAREGAAAAISQMYGRLAGAALFFLIGLNALPTAWEQPSPALVETPITGLSAPTAMAFAPDGRLFICQQGGQLRVIKNGALLPGAFRNFDG